MEYSESITCSVNLNAMDQEVAVKKHTIELDDEQLLSLTETVVMQYFIFYVEARKTMMFWTRDTLLFFYYLSVEEKFIELFELCLRKPLQDPEFRKKLNRYFDNHGLSCVRSCAWPLVSNFLQWDSDSE